jgi:hypothetical protein
MHEKAIDIYPVKGGMLGMPNGTFSADISGSDCALDIVLTAHIKRPSRHWFPPFS